MFRIPSTFAPPSADKIDKALAALSRELGPSKLLTAVEHCQAFEHDESEADGHCPFAVVLAQSAEDIRKALRIAFEANVPITPRAAGTGKSGGAVPVAGGIILSTLGMNQIKEIHRGDLVAVLEPGVVLQQLHQAVEAESLFYPPDPNSLENCAIGGNVAENAGGPRAFKYGVTRDYVLGLETVLMDGSVLRMGRRTAKGVAGYDLSSLMVGSEGTLGVFSEITVKLIPKPEDIATILALFSDVCAAARAVEKILRKGFVPRCLELVDEMALFAMRSSGFAIDQRAKAMLLIEVDGSAATCEEEMVKVGDACEGNECVELLVAQDRAKRDRLWTARRELSPSIRKLASFKISEDVVVPRSQIPNLLELVRVISEKTGIRCLAYGHAGDGNLHVNFLWDTLEEVANVKKAIEMMLRDVVALGGTISGEHGIGVLKRPYLTLEQSPALIQAQKQVKAVFDPKGLLNPGKIF